MENQLKATELRCGNLIYRYDKVVYTNIGILTKIQNRSVIYKPIQLTEDILVKLGFEKNGGRLTLGRFTYDSNQRRFEIEGYEYDFNGITFEASYVHQLQNVFFALTGEELTFKN